MTNLRERFGAKWELEKTTGCWLWTATITKNGYGYIRSGKRMIQAHRVSFEIHVGSIPKGMHCLHRCDVRNCVNPDHLFLGTNADNMADMVTKGRALRGETNGKAKLTDKEVCAILADSRSHRKIAADYNIGKTAVWQIKSGKTWNHVHASV